LAIFNLQEFEPISTAAKVGMADWAVSASGKEALRPRYTTTPAGEVPPLSLRHGHGNVCARACR